MTDWGKVLSQAEVKNALRERKHILKKLFFGVH